MDSANPNTSYCASELLQVEYGYASPPGAYWKRAYLGFNLGSIPSRAIVTSARFSAYLDSAGGTSPVALSVRRVTSAWNCPLDWSPQPGSELAASAEVGATSGWYHWPVTALVQKHWLGRDFGAGTNYGLALFGPESGGPNYYYRRHFRATEYGDSKYAPYLQVEYLLPTATPTPTATNTPTDTPTPTATYTPTNTPTNTRTYTPTHTRTATPTFTSTHSPTDTPTSMPAKSTVRGMVRLERRISNAGAEVCLDARCITTSEDGSYSFEDVTPGNHSLSVKRASYLSSKRAVEVPIDVLTLPDVTLLGGDIDQDDRIYSTDMVDIGHGWGAAPGDPAWDQRGDITDDGIINILDMVAVQFNWATTAPGPWSRAYRQAQLSHEPSFSPDMQPLDGTRVFIAPAGAVLSAPGQAVELAVRVGKVTDLDGHGFIH